MPKIKYQFLTANSISKPYYEVQLPPNTYFIEAWGAAGGGASGGMGGYTSGVIKLVKTTQLYIYIGGKGIINNDPQSSSEGGYNGGESGAPGRYYSNKQRLNGGSGGGATDVRTEPGAWSNSLSLNSRILVAGGGGGSCGNDWSKGGSGGGLEGGSSNLTTTNLCQGTSSLGGSQNNGELGKGQDAYVATNNTICMYEGNGGGGGGYTGGFSKQGDLNTAGGGGSSFIAGYNGCNTEETKYTFGLAVIRSGSETFPSPNGSLEIGHSGDGALIITIFRGCRYSCIMKPNKISLITCLIIFS